MNCECPSCEAKRNSYAQQIKDRERSDVGEEYEDYTQQTRKLEEYLHFYAQRISKDEQLRITKQLKELNLQLKVEKNTYTTDYNLIENYGVKGYTSHEINTSQGDDTMTGYEYVQPYNAHRANYKHLRAMLQEIWKRENTPSYLQFSIDQRYRQEARPLLDYLRTTYTVEQLNQAHNDARANYKIGRPKGALNKSRFQESTNNTIKTNLDSQLLDSLFDDTITK